MAKPKAGGTPATVALTAAKIAFTLHNYEHHDPAHASAESSAAKGGFGEEAATALGIDPRRMFKTLVADLGKELIVAVVPVSTTLDLKALADAAGAKKASMADPAAATRSSGYVLGGISPIGQRTRLRTVVDESALAFDTVFVSAGRRGASLELAPADLIAVTGAATAPIGH